MRLSLFSCVSLAAALLLASVSADEPKQKAPEGNAALERLKKLAGEWQDASAKDDAKGKVAVRYRLIGGGSTVAETIFPDTDMEMLSVYHADGPQLVMTHYCCVGNQPKFRAKPGATADEVVFEFIGGSNLNPATDPHIHDGRLKFIDADHLHTEWDYYVDGKLATKHSFDLVRKK